AERDKGVGVFGKDACLLRFPSGVDLDKQARAFARPVDFACKRRGDFFPIDRLDHVESLDRLPRLIALQRADQMKLDCYPEIARAAPQITPFRNSLLHPVLAK